MEMHAVEIGGKIIKKNQEEAQAHFMFLNAHIVESDSLPMVISIENIVATTVIKKIDFGVSHKLTLESMIRNEE